MELVPGGGGGLRVRNGESYSLVWLRLHLGRSDAGDVLWVREVVQRAAVLGGRAVFMMSLMLARLVVACWGFVGFCLLV